MITARAGTDRSSRRSDGGSAFASTGRERRPVPRGVHRDRQHEKHGRHRGAAVALADPPRPEDRQPDDESQAGAGERDPGEERRRVARRAVGEVARPAPLEHDARDERERQSTASDRERSASPPAKANAKGRNPAARRDCESETTSEKCTKSVGTSSSANSTSESCRGRTCPSAAGRRAPPAAGAAARRRRPAPARLTSAGSIRKRCEGPDLRARLEYFCRPARKRGGSSGLWRELSFDERPQPEERAERGRRPTPRRAPTPMRATRRAGRARTRRAGAARTPRRWDGRASSAPNAAASASPTAQDRVSRNQKKSAHGRGHEQLPRAVAGSASESTSRRDPPRRVEAELRREHAMHRRPREPKTATPASHATQAGERHEHRRLVVDDHARVETRDLRDERAKPCQSGKA